MHPLSLPSLALAMFICPVFAVDNCQVDDDGLRPYHLWPSIIVSADGRQRIPAEEGRLFVPEWRGDENPRCIEIAFLRFTSGAPVKRSPVFVIGGGPGEPIIEAVSDYPEDLAYYLELAEVADVVLIDQPSTGLSRPVLVHPQNTPLPLDKPFSRADAIKAATIDARSSVSFWRRRGVDFNGYTVMSWADHIDDLRHILGYERIAISGHSFGSHTAIALLRRHPAAIDRALVKLPEGPDQTYKLPALVDATLARFSAAIAEDDAWGELMPDLISRLSSLVASLNAANRIVRAGNGKSIRLGGDDLRLFVGKRIGDMDFLRRLPLLVTRMEKGDYSELAEFSLDRRLSGQLSSAGLWFHLADAASGISQKRLELLQDQSTTAFVGAFTDFPAYSISPDLWPVQDLGDDFRQPVRTDIPVQLYVNSLDGRTPPDNLADITRGFSNFGVIEIENLSHGYPDDKTIATRLNEDFKAFLAGAPVKNAHYHHPLLLAPPDKEMK